MAAARKITGIERIYKIRKKKTASESKNNGIRDFY